jgi:hypothetical protein
VRHALQWPKIILGAWSATANQEQRHTLQLRIGHCGDAVGHAWTGGDQDDTKLPGERCVSMGHVHGGAFIAHIDDAYPLLHQLIPDWLDMTALETEHPIHLSGNEKLHDQFSD